MASPLEALVSAPAELNWLLRILTHTFEGAFLFELRPISDRDPIFFTNIFIDLNFVGVDGVETVFLTTRDPVLLTCFRIPKIRPESGSV